MQDDSVTLSMDNRKHMADKCAVSQTCFDVNGKSQPDCVSSLKCVFCELGVLGSFLQSIRPFNIQFMRFFLHTSTAKLPEGTPQLLTSARSLWGQRSAGLL